MKSSSSNSCSTTLQCDDHTTRMSCYYNNYYVTTDFWSCNCNSTLGNHYYEVRGVDSSNACAYTVDLCINGFDPDFSTDRVCDVDYQSLTSTNCNLSLLCTQSQDLGGGISMIANDSTWADCYENGTTTDCSCYSQSGNYSFELPEKEVSVDTCRNAVDVCELVGEAVPEGEITCEQTGQWGQGNWCSGTTTCTQYADVNGVQVGMQGYYEQSCSKLEGNTWECTCRSGPQMGSIEVESNSAWDACTETAAACPELVDLVIGGGGYYPPYYDEMTPDPIMSVATPVAAPQPE